MVEDDEEMPEWVRLASAVALLVVGEVVVITAIFRALGQNWPLEGHERWLIPAVGLGLMALGGWLLP